MNERAEMNNILIYLLKVNLLALILWGFYRMFLHRQNLSQLNRFILLAIPFIALGVPLLKFQPLHQEFLAVLDLSPASAGKFRTEYSPSPVPVTREQDLGGILLWFYMAGVILFLCRTLIQLIRLVRLKRSSGFRKEGRMLYILTDHPRAFSFFNWIFIPGTSGEKTHIITEHEEIHARQVHSLDLLWAELWLLLFWYNPVFHLIKSGLKETHEFIADRLMVLREGGSSVYARALLADAEARMISGFVSHFSYKSLKQNSTILNQSV